MIAGLTGSIATGKSTVSRFFAALGAVIIDADKIVRQVQQPGERAWQEIVEAFGEEILLPNRELDRAKLGSLVFGNEANRQRLNGIVHPRVREERDRQTQEARAQDPDAIIIWDIPLLIETGMHQQVDQTIVVYVDVETQLARLLSRDELTEDAARQRIAAQMSIEEKRKYADFLIDNRGPLAETEAQVRAVWAHLQGAAEGSSE
ncbi:dephospho-CoA kinase [Tumebacillus permanentifrigoris]|uniref:Dephospho-CoA kinase n=1 Tax=Tumebacillus permanentifrigoris TaxID=378543 RepID=A0A316D9N7_9BACL|nr:dephospho-CoA kinase [Tumebacillus permanentifrigoris]PWK13888.1 dephospho-CoA kinase [Tumebacillus permanentifrigoris]